MIDYDIKGRSVAVIGLGISGRSAARLLLQKGALVFGVDDGIHQLQKAGILDELGRQGLRLGDNGKLTDLKSCDLVVVSPGIPQENRWYCEALKLKIPIIGEVELACRFLTNKMVGITGSNGKTTVTSLVSHLLNGSGIPSRPVGNIGVPLTSLIGQCGSDEVLVVELSSYQLETLQSQVFDAGAILNITPNHLDRYPSMDAYAQAKLQLRFCLKKGATLYMQEGDAAEYRGRIRGFPVKTFGYSAGCDLYCDREQVFLHEKIEHILPVGYRGIISHDLDNLLAAYALCRELGADPAAMFEALKMFKKPPHRVEFVRKVGGVSYIDDSKATSIDAVVRAVGSVQGPVVLIAGGVHKGAPYTPWIGSFKGKVKHVFALGQAAPLMEKDLSAEIPVTLCATLDEAVKGAERCALSGECVLLSPGCSSFDMFKDYAHRGEVFQKLVSQIKE